MTDGMSVSYMAMLLFATLGLGQAIKWTLVGVVWLFTAALDRALPDVPMVETVTWKRWRCRCGGVGASWTRVPPELRCTKCGDSSPEPSMSRAVITDLVERITALPPALEDSDIVEIEARGTCRDPWESAA